MFPSNTLHCALQRRYASKTISASLASHSWRIHQCCVSIHADETLSSLFVSRWRPFLVPKLRRNGCDGGGGGGGGVGGGECAAMCLSSLPVHSFCSVRCFIKALKSVLHCWIPASLQQCEVITSVGFITIASTSSPWHQGPIQRVHNAVWQ